MIHDDHDRAYKLNSLYAGHTQNIGERFSKPIPGSHRRFLTIFTIFSLYLRYICY